MNCAMTKKDLATLAGYSYRRLFDIDQELPKEQKLYVPGEGGKYDLAFFIQRWVAYNVSNERGADDTLEKEKARHEKVKIQKTELEVAKMKGRLVDVEEFRRVWADIAKTVVQALLQMPSKVAPQLLMANSVEMITGIIDEEMRNILTQISETPLPAYLAQGENAADEDDDSE